MNRRWITVGRWLLLVALVAAAAAFAVWSPSLDIDGLQSAAARWGVWAPLAFAGVYVAATLLVVPKNVLTIGAGLVFGIVPGTLVYAALGAFGSAPTSWPFVVAASVLGAGTVAALVAGLRRRRDRPSRTVPPSWRWPAPEVGE